MAAHERANDVAARAVWLAHAIATATCDHPHWTAALEATGFMTGANHRAWAQADTVASIHHQVAQMCPQARHASDQPGDNALPLRHGPPQLAILTAQVGGGYSLRYALRFTGHAYRANQAAAAAYASTYHAEAAYRARDITRKIALATAA